MKKLFGNEASVSVSCSSTVTGEGVLARAEQLCKQMRSRKATGNKEQAFNLPEKG